MNTNRTNNKGLLNSSFFSSNFFFFILLIFLLPIIYIWYKNQKSKDIQLDSENLIKETEVKEKEARNLYKDPIKADNDAKKIEVSSRLRNVAKNLALFLGTDNKSQFRFGENFLSFDWLNGLTENEDAVMKEFNKIHYKEMPVIKKLYSQIYAVGRDLQADCKKYLSEEQYSKIRWSGTK